MLIVIIDGGSISYEIALRWLPLKLNDDKSTLVQVMAWCHQATSHYLNQCWPRSLPPYGITRPQWVKYQQLNCLFYSFFMLTTKTSSNLCMTACCEVEQPVTGGFPPQRDRNVESVFIPWCLCQIRSFESFLFVTTMQCLIMQSFFSKIITKDTPQLTRYGVSFVG